MATKKVPQMAGATRPTAAQRRVLEALAAGGNLWLSRVTYNWHLGHKTIPQPMYQAMHRARWIASSDKGRTLTITDAGREVLATTRPVRERGDDGKRTLSDFNFGKPR